MTNTIHRMTPRNFGRDAKQKQQRAARVAEQELDWQDGDYLPPSQEECDDKLEYYYHVDDEGSVIVWDRTYRIDGILRRFSVEVHVRTIRGEFRQLIRFCCSHGRFHSHTGPEGDTINNLMQINSLVDLQSAYDQASSLAVTVADDALNRKDSDV